MLAERPPAEEEALDRFGRNLGIAFQLVDDMLDFSARQAELGKSVGDDFRDGKITLPILLAFARGDEEERAFWRRTLEDMDQQPGDLERAILLVERHGALAETLSRARSYAAAAIDALSMFRDGAERRALTRPPPSPTSAASERRSDRPSVCLARRPHWRYTPPGRRSVAQPGRALLSGGRGRRFKSSHSDHQTRWLKNRPR